MSLSDLIRGKPVSVAVATSTPATHPQTGMRTVATVATVAVANPAEAWPAWRLHFTDSDPLSVSFCPAATHAEALGHYPEAIAAEPIPERARRAATKAEADELQALIERTYCDDTEAEQADALQAALSDPERALTCYRSMFKGRNFGEGKPR